MSNEFTFAYNATAGVLIAAALREKAEVHRREADEYRKATGSMASFYAVQAIRSDNNAKLLEDAADEIHAPVQKSIAESMGNALRRAGIVE